MGDAYENAEQNDENGHADGESVPTRPRSRLLLGLPTCSGILVSLLRAGLAVGVMIGGVIGVIADMLAGRWAALVIFLIQHIVHSNENHGRSAGR